MRILVISTSMHDGSNSHGLAEAFAEGARQGGAEVDTVSLRGLTILPCQACYKCSEHGRCAQHDDAPAIIDLIARADAICWATPTYFYAMCGQMKCLLDRTTPLFGKPVPFHDIYLLVTAGEDDPNILGRVAQGLQGWIDCYDGTGLRGSVFAGGLNEPNAIRRRTDALDQARNLGLQAGRLR